MDSANVARLRTFDDDELGIDPEEEEEDCEDEEEEEEDSCHSYLFRHCSRQIS